MASIVDDPSQWTSKPKDIFADKVKQSLDQRGWGQIEGAEDATVETGKQVDDGTEHSIRDYHSLRSDMDTLRSHFRGKMRTAERDGDTAAARKWRQLYTYADRSLRGKPMDGGGY